MEDEAEQPVTQLVSRIFDNVLDLSTVLAAHTATSTRPGATRPAQTCAALPSTSHSRNTIRVNRPTEAAERQEMHSIFSGTSSSVRQTSTSSGKLRLSSRPNSAMSVARSNGNRFQQLGSQSLTTSTPLARSNQRTLDYSFSRPSKGNRAQASKNKGLLTVDLLLLPNPTMDIVAKQAPKVELIEKGRLVIGAQLMKEWTPSEIIQKIR